jgi:rhamnosyl/mannosyltransferase
VGRLSYYKGFDVLVRAVARTPGVTLDILGDGKERTRLHALIRQLQLEDRVVLHGHVTDAEREAKLAACDCLCLPSIERSEAFGLVLLEGMAAARACVTTAVPGTGMGWIVQNQVTGLVVKPASEIELATALKQLADYPGLREAMGQAGRKRFQAHFRIDRSAEKVLEAYKEVIDESGLRHAHGCRGQTGE